MKIRGVILSKFIKKILVLTLLSTFVVVNNLSGEQPGYYNKDYFIDKKLIKNVEKNHFSKDNFWRKLRAGHYKYAFGDLKYILKVYPNHPGALSMMEVVGPKIGDYTLPGKYYIRALKMFPQHAITHAQYGYYLIKVGGIDIGINRLKAAIKLKPNLVNAYVWLSGGYYKKGNLSEARNSYEKAKKLGYKGKPAWENND